MQHSWRIDFSQGIMTVIASPVPAGAPTAAIRRRVVLSAAIGNIAEYYDFSLFVFLSTTIGRLYFPSHDASASTLASLAAFGVAFLARPLGGAILGPAADRLGRKGVMLFTFVMMAVATVGIGLLPDYAAIGIWAPILLVTLRVIQGISAGGEWGTSMTYGVEWAPQNRRALFGGIIQAGNAVGTIIATGVIAILILILGPEAFEAWGWRIAFLFGIAILPIGLYLRRHASESPLFEQSADAEAPTVEVKSPALVTENAPQKETAGIGAMLLFFGVMCLPSAAVPTTAKYLPTFAEQYAGVSKSAAMWSTSFTTLLMVLMTPVVGILSDRCGRRPFLLASTLLYAVAIWPMFNAMATFGGLHWLIVAQCVFAVATALTYGPIGATLVEMFSTVERAGKLSILHSIEIAVVGGFSPFAAGFFISRTGDPGSMAYYLVPMAAISFFTVLRMKETAFRPLR
ncbi:MAG: MFS transporter [Sphingobium sp.]